MTDVRLIAIIDPALLAGRDLVTVARAIERGGATALQLRMKAAGAGEYAQRAAELVSAVRIPVYVNDRADVAWASGAAGVHLGADDLPANRVIPASPSPIRIGVSVGDLAEARAAAQFRADYWSVGPVYSTRHKDDAGPALGIDGFKSLAALASPGTPVIAIGGITADRMPELRKAGAAGVAVIGAILDAPDPESATRRLRDA